jgi:hypothetical protein
MKLKKRFKFRLLMQAGLCILLLFFSMSNLEPGEIFAKVQDVQSGKEKFSPLLPSFFEKDHPAFLEIQATGYLDAIKCDTAKRDIKGDQSKIVKASYYGRELMGKRMANGERFDPKSIHVAHRTLPIDSVLEITNTENNKIVIASVEDRGPYVRSKGRHAPSKYDRELDLSLGAATVLDPEIKSKGILFVRMRVVYIPPES